jgi:hypothetical protein
MALDFSRSGGGEGEPSSGQEDGHGIRIAGCREGGRSSWGAKGD